MAAPKNSVRDAIRRVLKDEPDGLYRRDIVSRAGMLAPSTDTAIRDMLRVGELERLMGRPCRYRLPDVSDVVPPRSINIWALPQYIPPPWPVRSDAGRVRA